jgi:hypothetical protein
MTRPIRARRKNKRRLTPAPFLRHTEFMLLKKPLRIFFLIASLLFAQHAAALHLFAHAFQANDSVVEMNESKQDSELANKKLCELCLTLADLGHGIVSSATHFSLQQNQYHFTLLVDLGFSPHTLLAFHSRAPPAA